MANKRKILQIVQASPEDYAKCKDPDGASKYVKIQLWALVELEDEGQQRKVIGMTGQGVDIVGFVDELTNFVEYATGTPDRFVYHEE